MADQEMGFRLLGPMGAWYRGERVDLGPVRQRCVLAVLLLEANRRVSVDQLVERVWSDRRLPERPRNAVQTYVALLRRALTGIAGVSITRQSGGYLISLDEQLVDVHEFHRLIEQASAAGDDNRRITLLERALGLWRGEALADLNTLWIDSVRDSLDRQRQAAERDLTDLQLRQGLHHQLLARLFAWAAQHPLDERLIGQLMLALFRDGRQADALREYQRMREQLADAMGTDPGPALQDLYQRILTQDSTLMTSASAPAPPTSAHPPALRQLPSPPRLFTGRAEELAHLDKILDDHADDANGPVVISAIGGTGGIGKTWLALHWAHQHLDRFPDGQFHVNLRGFDPTGQPVAPATALRGFLEALGVAPAAIPSDLDAQAGLYRGLLAGKRMLIVLDNARDTSQVIPLLPGSPTCTVLVTSRRQLGGLVTKHGARALTLDVLPEPEARHLLIRHLGHERVAAEPRAVADLLAGCAGLPLAVGIVAARATRHPHFPLAALADELRDHSRRLDALDPGDPHTTLRAVLSWSTKALSEPAAAAFGLLGHAPGPDIGLSAAASLLAQPEPATSALLRELADASLLQEHVPGRYRMHDLVRLYATDHADRGQAPTEWEAALRRVLDHYIQTAHAVDRLLDPHRDPIVLDPPTPGVHPQPLPDARAALAWFTAEHANLLAAQHTAAQHTWHSAVWQLAWLLDTFHYRRGHRHDRLVAWRAALDAASHLPDPTTRILAHRFLGRTCGALDRREDGIRHMRHALALAEDHHDASQQAHSHRALALASALWGDHRKAFEHAIRARDLFRAVDQPVWEADALNGVGWYAARLGEYDTARTHCQAALTLHRHHSYPAGEADTLDSLGYIAHHTGDHQEAIDCYEQSLTLYRALGNTAQAADTLDRLGHPYLALGEPEQARVVWRETLRLYQEQGRDTDADRVRHQLDTLGSHANIDVPCQAQAGSTGVPDRA